MMYLGNQAVGIAVKYDYSIRDIAENGPDMFPEDIELPSDVTNIADFAFVERQINHISGQGVTTIGARAFDKNRTPQAKRSVFSFDFPNLETTGAYAFGYNNFGGAGATTNVIRSYGSQFESAMNLPWVKYTRANIIGNDEVYNCTSVTKIIINSKPTQITASAFRKADNLTDIYVPWSEGEVANAPWGATNATIHYNTVFDENGEVTPNA